MIGIECPYCGQVNWMNEVNEEPFCELCDNYLEGVEPSYKKEETDEEE